jgi:hypothetical protein
MFGKERSFRKRGLGTLTSVLLATLLFVMVPTGPVLAQNSPPVAVNDYYTMDEDTVLNVPAPGVLANDSDADSDPLTITRLGGPSRGTLTLSDDGSFTYIPRPDFSGED